VTNVPYQERFAVSSDALITTPNKIIYRTWFVFYFVYMSRNCRIKLLFVAFVVEVDFSIAGYNNTINDMATG